MAVVVTYQGYDSAVSRHHLAARFGWHERKVSAVVESLRKNHRQPILANREAGGFFMPTCLEDERRALAPAVAKVRSEFDTLRTMSATVAHTLAADLFRLVEGDARTYEQQCLHPQCSNPVPAGNANYCGVRCQDSYLYTARSAGWPVAPREEAL